MSWQTFETESPDLAAFARERLHGGVAYLATVRPDGGPRVHPVTPAIGEGHIFVFMEDTSPKGKDLQRDARFALHGSVSDSSGTGGEIILTGTATLVQDPATRAQAERVCSYRPSPAYIAFELDPESAMSTTYDTKPPTRQRWKKQNG